MKFTNFRIIINYFSALNIEDFEKANIKYIYEMGNGMFIREDSENENYHHMIIIGHDELDICYLLIDRDMSSYIKYVPYRRSSIDTKNKKYDYISMYEGISNLSYMLDLFLEKDKEYLNIKGEELKPYMNLQSEVLDKVTKRKHFKNENEHRKNIKYTKL